MPDFEHYVPGAPGSPASGAYGQLPAVPAPKVAVGWAGVVMAVGALVAALGAFLPWEKFVVFLNGSTTGTVSLTGVGSQTVTGQPGLAVTDGNAGKIVVGAAAFVLLAGLLVVVKRGRLGVGIVSLPIALVSLALAAASLGAAKNDLKTLTDAAHQDGVTYGALTRVGVPFSLAGSVMMLVGAVAAIAVRRRHTV